jgi:hypothetical protein
MKDTKLIELVKDLDQHWKEFVTEFKNLKIILGVKEVNNDTLLAEDETK